jgi:hypothetical protein
MKGAFPGCFVQQPRTETTFALWMDAMSATSFWKSVILWENSDGGTREKSTTFATITSPSNFTRYTAPSVPLAIGSAGVEERRSMNVTFLVKGDNPYAPRHLY